jgi:hypothetical protein
MTHPKRPRDSNHSKIDLLTGPTSPRIPDSPAGFLESGRGCRGAGSGRVLTIKQKFCA